MRKILFILLLAPFALKSQTVNTFRDSTWFKRGVRFDSTLVFSKGAGVGKVWTSNANGTGSWQTISSAGVTQGALDDSISAVRAIRKVDTIYKNLDSIVFKINEIRYSVLDSTGGGVQTLSISGDTLSISGGNSVVLPVYVQVDSAIITSYDVLNSQNAPPGSPATGDIYLVGNSPSGAWVGHAKDVAEWNGSAWVFTDGVQGDFLYNATTALTYIFRSGNWVQTTGIPALNNGNTISSGLTIGTNNARSLNFETNNINRGRFDSIGRFHVYDTSLRKSNKYLQIDSITGRLVASEISGGAGSSTVALDKITDATDTSTINNGNFQQEWKWNSLSSGIGLKLSSSSTAAASNTQTLFSVNQSGANATSSQTTYGAQISNTKTGAGSTNYGLKINVSGADNNLGLYINSPAKAITIPTSGGDIDINGNKINYTSSMSIYGTIQNLFYNAGSRPHSLYTSNPCYSYFAADVINSQPFTINRAATRDYELMFGGVLAGASTWLSYESSINTIRSLNGTLSFSANTGLAGGFASYTPTYRFTVKPSGAINFTPITATAASAITPAEGDVVMVSSTDATFTSIGLWGYQNGSWQKL